MKTIKYIIKTLGLCILISGVVSLIKPDFIFNWILENLDNSYMYIAAIVLRIGFGILLILIAKESRWPDVFRILGSLAIIAGIAFACMGQEQFIEFITHLVNTLKKQSSLLGVLTVAIGVLLFYALSTKGENSQID